MLLHNRKISGGLSLALSQALIGLMLLVTTEVQAVEVSYENLQAAYIHKFTNYIEWPNTKSHNFVIGVVSNPDAYEALRNELDGAMIENRRVKVIKLDKIDPNEKYDILHVTKIDRDILKEIPRTPLKNASIISQDPQGLNEHALINFFMEDSGKLRFDINKAKATQLDIRINSRLLNLARKIK